MAPRTKSPTLTTTRGTPSSQTSSSLKQNYLLAYNVVSFALWSILTLRMAMLVPMLAPRHDLAGVFDHLFSPLLTFTQSLAILEVVHALVGLVRASPVTTLMQVASRYLVVWFVCFVFPEIIVGKELPVGKFRMGGSGLGQWAFIGCLAAWGPTEMIKYGYFVYQLGLGGAPRWLNWLRYNTFFVLYPIGISSEVILIWLAAKPAASVSPWYAWFLLGALVIYVPGSYILYTHMMSQRRRVMKGKSKGM